MLLRTQKPSGHAERRPNRRNPLARPEDFCVNRCEATKPRKITWYRLGLLLAALWFSSTATLQAQQASVTLAWNPLFGILISGYNVYYGTSSGNYTKKIWVGNNVSATLTGLSYGTTYYIAVSVVDILGIESAPSGEIVYTPTAPIIPRPSLAVQNQSGGRLALNGTGPAGKIYDILATQDFASWRVIGTLTNVTGSFSFLDPAASRYSSRFYRLREVSLTELATLPKLQLAAATARQMTLQINGQIAHTYDVLATTDFISWQAIGTVVPDSSGKVIFTDPNAALFQHRFYRLHDISYALVQPQGMQPSAKLAPAAGGQFLLQISGQIGHGYEVIASQDLTTWTLIGMATAGSNGQVQFLDQNASNYPCRFYRLRQAF